MRKFIKSIGSLDALLIITIINTISILVLIFFPRNYRGVFDIIGIYITAFLGYLVYKLQTQKDKFEYAMQRPLLNFINIKDIGWVILNVGNGPALYIRFMGKTRTDWELPVIGYAIPPNKALTIQVEIEDAGAKLAVYYKDLFENEYMVECESDTNSIVCKRGDKNWSEDLYYKIHHKVKRSDRLHLISL